MSLSRWDKLIRKSEKIVCYPSSFINIKYLLSDDLASVISQIRKLIGTKHPLLKTARSIIGDGHTVNQIRGLIVLLISKAFNPNPNNINNYQRSLSEIVETAHAAVSIHKGIVNLNNKSQHYPIKWIDEMQFGNKMATLCGDYLLASVSRALAELNNTKVVDKVSKGIGDTVESNFMVQPTSKDDYEQFIYKSCGSLLSECCESTILLCDDVEDYSESELKNLESIAGKWTEKWAQLYCICEDMNNLILLMNHGRSTTEIFNHQNQDNRYYCDHECLEDHDGLLLRFALIQQSLDTTYDQLVSIQQNLGYNHQCVANPNVTSAQSIIQDMAHLLYDDAQNNLRYYRCEHS